MTVPFGRLSLGDTNFASAEESQLDVVLGISPSVILRKALDIACSVLYMLVRAELLQNLGMPPQESLPALIGSLK